MFFEGKSEDRRQKEADLAVMQGRYAGLEEEGKRAVREVAGMPTADDFLMGEYIANIMNGKHDAEVAKLKEALTKAEQAAYEAA